MSDLKSVFETIAATNHWGNDESVSGDGSTLSYTFNLRRELGRFLVEFEIRGVFDAPCGDFNWMREVAFPKGVNYIGGDIVPAIIAANNAKYASSARRFLEFNIVTDAFPDCDLWFCRDCLFHLPFAAIRQALHGFAASKARYLMTTTHLNTTGFANRDIEAGDFRLIDLHAAPFGLPRDVVFRIADYVFPYPPREMCVWTREQVIETLAAAP